MVDLARTLHDLEEVRDNLFGLTMNEVMTDLDGHYVPPSAADHDADGGP